MRRSPTTRKAAMAAVIVGCMLLCFGAQAQVFHVATTGNDTTGTGSVGAPWATVTKAVNTVPDGATVLVAPGTYNQRMELDREFASGITIRAEPAYQARFRFNGGAVVRCYYGRNITVEGFDIAHDPANTTALVVQIQDLLGANAGPGPTGTDPQVRNITLRNNIIHDSTNNDLIKVNNGCRDILFEGNVFYNQFGSDEHIDVNSVTGVTIRGNIFFNDFAASGRTNPGDTSAYIVVKDSNGNDDDILGTKDTVIEKNVFLHWQGNTGSGFISLGEDGTANYECDGVLVENNVFLGDGSSTMRSAWTIRGARNATFRTNTIHGNLPSRSFALRMIRNGLNPANTNIAFYNNAWSDPAGSMGTEALSGADWSESPAADNDVVTLLNNAYWNNGAALPADAAQEVRITNDPDRVTTNPQLPSLAGLTVRPWWNSATNQFGGGYATIAAAHAGIVNAYARPGATSALLGEGLASQLPTDDILGVTRVGKPADIGAVQGSTAVAPTTPHHMRVY